MDRKPAAHQAREPIPLSAAQAETIRQWWGCATARCRGFAWHVCAYHEEGVEYVQAECLRCGQTTRYPSSEVD